MRGFLLCRTLSASEIFFTTLQVVYKGATSYHFLMFKRYHLKDLYFSTTIT